MCHVCVCMRVTVCIICVLDMALCSNAHCYKTRGLQTATYPSNVVLISSVPIALKTASYDNGSCCIVGKE